MDAKTNIKSRLPSRHVTEGPARAPHRSYYYAMGLTKEQIHQPFVGVASCWNEAAPCNISLMRQAQAAKKGVASAGGTPREFCTITVTDGIAMGHAGMYASLPSRDLIADSVELTIGAAIETGKPVLAVEGDSAFGFSGMEVETICRYNLPVCVVIFNNNGIYRGTDVNSAGSDVATTVFVKDSRYDKMMEAFGGVGINATTPDELKRAVDKAMDSGKPTLINAVIDPAAGSESGRIGNLNPQSVIRKK